MGSGNEKNPPLTEKQTFLIVEDLLYFFLDKTSSGWALRAEAEEGRIVFILPDQDLQRVFGQVVEVINNEASK